MTRQALRYLVGKRILLTGTCDKTYISKNGALHMTIKNVQRADTLEKVADHVTIIRQYDIKKLLPFEKKHIGFSAQVYAYTTRRRNGKIDYSVRDVRSVTEVPKGD